jgi:hypothetical protein
MAIKNDTWITRIALEHQMIEPFVDGQMRDRVISTASPHMATTCALATVQGFTNVFNTVVGPKNFDPKSFVDMKADVCIIPPIRSPSPAPSSASVRQVLTICLGKSTYARCGIIVNVRRSARMGGRHVGSRIRRRCRPKSTNEGIAGALRATSHARSHAGQKGKCRAARRDAAAALTQAGGRWGRSDG